jgi:hypothetical protein
MAQSKLTPALGINTVSADDALVRKGGRFVRDALNLDITPEGRADLRPSPTLVAGTPYANLWQSPLHGDVFATLRDMWVKVDPLSWECVDLAVVGEGVACHAVLNNKVVVAAPAGLFVYDGQRAEPLALPTPPPPLVLTGQGSMLAGRYGVAVAWLRHGLESAPSPLVFVDGEADGALDITWPLCLDATVTGMRLYITEPNGGEPLTVGDYPLGAAPLHLPLLPAPGRPSPFVHREPLPTGRYLAVWKGRLMTADTNVLRWSDALAYHLHDTRFNFILFPQRITFLVALDGGVWVGQVDHVVFLAGADPDSLTLQRKAARPPIPGSALMLPAEYAGEASPDGGPVALWLAANGYVLGTAAGTLQEIHAQVLDNITGQRSTSVVLDGRIMTAVT